MNTALFLSANAPRILIVDDEPASLRLALFALQGEGFRLSIAGTAGAALASLDRERPDLVLLDYHLPDFSGMELASWLLQAPAFTEIPVVLWSSESPQPRWGLDPRCLRGFIRNPIDTRCFAAELRGFLAPMPVRS